MKIHIQKTVYCSIIYNCKKLEKTKMPTNRNKLWYIYNIGHCEAFKKDEKALSTNIKWFLEYIVKWEKQNADSINQML